MPLLTVSCQGCHVDDGAKASRQAGKQTVDRWDWWGKKCLKFSRFMALIVGFRRVLLASCICVCMRLYVWRFPGGFLPTFNKRYLGQQARLVKPTSKRASFLRRYSQIIYPQGSRFFVCRKELQ